MKKEHEVTLEEDLEDILGPAPQRKPAPVAPLPGAIEPGEEGQSREVLAAPPPSPTLPWPLNLTDDELHQEELAAARSANARQIRFAQEHAAGASVIDAARRAGMSMKNASPWKTAHRLVVAKLVAILREQARRRAHYTVEMAVAEFRAIGDEARAAGDYSAATRAKREAGLLLGLYPETRLKLQLEAPAVEPRTITPEEWEALARLRHVVRPALPQTVESLAQLVTGEGSDAA